MAQALGLDDETVSRFERSAAPPKKGDTYRRLVEFYGYKLADVDAMWRNPKRQRERIPSNFDIRRVSGVGADNFTSEFEIDLESTDVVPGALYPFPMQDPMVLRVSGDSMTYAGPDSLRDGDDVIFANELEEDIPDGELVVAYHKGFETQTVKRLKKLAGGKLQLVPLNPDPKYKPITVEPEDVVLRAVKVVIKYPYRRKPR